MYDYLSRDWNGESIDLTLNPPQDAILWSDEGGFCEYGDWPWCLIPTHQDNFNMRSTGYFIPPETGEYMFFIKCDDQVKLYFSEVAGDETQAVSAIRLKGWMTRQLFLADQNQHVSRPTWVKLQYNRHSRSALKSVLKMAKLAPSEKTFLKGRSLIGH